MPEINIEDQEETEPTITRKRSNLRHIAQNQHQNMQWNSQGKKKVGGPK